MAALINTPGQQSNQPLPGFIDATDANPAGEDSFEARGIAKFGQGCEFVLGGGQGGASRSFHSSTLCWRPSVTSIGWPQETRISGRRSSQKVYSKANGTSVHAPSRATNAASPGRKTAGRVRMSVKRPSGVSQRTEFGVERICSAARRNWTAPRLVPLSQGNRPSLRRNPVVFQGSGVHGPIVRTRGKKVPRNHDESKRIPPRSMVGKDDQRACRTGESGWQFARRMRVKVAADIPVQITGEERKQPPRRRNQRRFRCVTAPMLFRRAQCSATVRLSGMS